MQIALQDDKPAKALTSRAIEAMKPTSKELADSGENRGLRVTCGAKGIKTFIYRYRSPLTNKLVQISIGHYPTVSLAEARLNCAELKLMRANGRCPASDQRER